MYIKDLYTGNVRLYGADKHDSLVISDDGRKLTYYNLQNGEGSKYGDYRFTINKEGELPEDNMELKAYGADFYFNIGGFGYSEVINEPLASYIAELIIADFNKYSPAPSLMTGVISDMLLQGKFKQLKALVTEELMKRLNSEVKNEN